MGLSVISVTYTAWKDFVDFKSGAIGTYYLETEYQYTPFVYDPDTNLVVQTLLDRTATNDNTTAFEGDVKGDATLKISIAEGIVDELTA